MNASIIDRLEGFGLRFADRRFAQSAQTDRDAQRMLDDRSEVREAADAAKREYRRQIASFEAMRKLLDILPVPAWLKEWDDERGEFRLRHANAVYAWRFGLGDTAVGRLDTDIWGECQGRRSSASDWGIVAEGAPAVTRNVSIPRVPGAEATVTWDFLLRSPVRWNGHMGIAGVLMNLSEVPDAITWMVSSGLFLDVAEL